MTIDLATNAELQASKAGQLSAFSGFSLLHIKGEIAECLQTFGRLGIFEEYTKHDISHVNGLASLLDWLIPADTQAIMTDADWLLAVLSVYLHDFGLLVTRNEYEERQQTDFPVYRDTFTHSTVENVQMVEYLNRLQEEDREKFLYQEFVRIHHPTRIRGWIDGTVNRKYGGDPALIAKLQSLTANLDRKFTSDLGLVCQSHHLEDIYNIDKYPTSRPYGPTPQETANVQYAAIVLRAADLLHITRDRAPSTAFEVISPSNPISQTEWSKQNAVRSVRSRPATNDSGDVDQDLDRDTIEIHATFTDADGFFGLTAYLQYAAKELAECYKWADASNRRYGVKHRFPWRRMDTSHIEAVGFITRPFEFQIDQHKILELLTGHTLYNDTGVVVREIVQNAIDAVRLEEFAHGDRCYRPTVLVDWSSTDRTLTVTDNGTGMTEDIIESNFLRVGSSRYNETQFLKEYPGYSSISRFGIGALSAFMVADDVQVVTVSKEEDEARHLTLRTVHGQYLVKLLEKDSPEVPSHIRDHGTSVSLRLRKGAQLVDILETLKKWVIVPRCAVTYSVDGRDRQTVGFSDVTTALKGALVELGAANETQDGLISSNKDPIQIRTVEADGISIAYAVRWDKWFSEWQFLPGPSNQRDETQNREFRIGTCVEGIRVTLTSPGYSDRSIVALADAKGKRAPRTNVARDALEITAEYTDYISAVYRAYVGHVLHEMERIKTSRKSSLTRATREGVYLTARIAHRNGTSPQELFVLYSILREVPVFLIEQAGTRRACSLVDLDEDEELVSVESQVVNHLEYVLDALPVSVSMTNVLSSLGNKATQISSKRLLCGDIQSGIFASLFREEWEVSEIAVNEDAQEVLATWTKKGQVPRWISPWQLTFDSAIDEQSVLLRRLSVEPTNSVLAPTNVGDITVSGLSDYELIRIAGQLYMLPSCSLLTFESADEGGFLAQEKLAWLAGLIASVMLSSRRRRQVYELRLGESNDALMNELERENLLGFVNWSSVRRAISSFSGRTFDVYRWERRYDVIDPDGEWA